MPAGSPAVLSDGAGFRSGRMFDGAREWIQQHPARAASLAGWYQQGAAGVVTLCLIPLLLQKLGPEQAGLWFSFQGILALLNLSDFGFAFALSRQTSYTLASEGSPLAGFLQTAPGPAGVAGLAQCADRVFGVLGGATCLVLVILHEAVFPLTMLGAGQAAWAWYALGTSAVLQLLLKGPAALLEGAGRASLVRILAGTYQLVSGGMALLILLVKPTLAAVGSGFFLASLCHYVAVRHAARRIAVPGGLPPADRSRLIRGLWSVAAPIGIMSLGGFFVMAIQVPLIAFLFGPARVVPFYAAQKVGLMLMAACSQLLSPQLPFFTMDWARKDEPAARTRMRRSFRVFAGATIFCQACFFLFTPSFAQLWLGAGQFVDSMTLGLLALDYTLLSVTGGYGQFILAIRRSPFTTSTLLMGVLNLLACVSLGPRFGFAGIAACSLVSGLLTNYWWIPFYGRRFFGQGPAARGLAA